VMVNKDDVEKLIRERDDEGTIVLTGDSDNLQIDLGKVVDDGSDTIVSGRKQAEASDSITFGDELEVVNFDDGNTKDLSQTRPTKAGVSFTDSNTAVVTAVDDTNATGTGPIAFTTDQVEPQRAASSSNDSARRSVRSNRARVEAAPVHWIWVALLALTFVVGGVFCVPYLVMHAWPTEQKDAAGNVLRGTQSGFWTGMASGAIGFTVEPDKRVYLDRNKGSTWTRNPDTNAGVQENRAEKMLTPKGGTPLAAKARVEHFIIEKIEGTTAISRKNDVYEIKEASVAQPNGEARVVPYVNVGYGDAGIAGSTAAR
jgi:hypothetical protein